MSTLTCAKFRELIKCVKLIKKNTELNEQFDMCQIS